MTLMCAWKWTDMPGKPGPKATMYRMSKLQALHLVKILSELTPQRVGSNEEFLFLSALVKDIESTFRDSEQKRNLTVSESGDSDYGRRIYG